MQTQLSFSNFLAKTDGGRTKRLTEESLPTSLFSSLFKPKMLESGREGLSKITP